MAAGKNVKFQGSALAIAMTKAATKTITAITKAKPAVVTITAHGYANGSLVYLAGIVGMTELNGGWYYVQNTAANTFELRGIDSTGYTTYTSGGTAQAPIFSNWCEIKGWNVSGGQAAEIDVTTICSVSKEYETGLQDFGTVATDYNFVPKTAIQVFLEAAKASAESVPMQLTLPASQGVLTYLMGITQVSYNGAVDGVWAGSAALRIKEAPSVV